MYHGSRQNPTHPATIQKIRTGGAVRSLDGARTVYCGRTETSSSHFCKSRLRSSDEPYFLKS